MQEGTLAFEELGHEGAERLSERQNNEEVDNDLQNAVGGHDLEFLRLEQSVDQVRKKEYGGDAANDVIHLMSFTGGRKP
jgi:hypothetical protein